MLVTRPLTGLVTTLVKPLAIGPATSDVHVVVETAPAVPGAPSARTSALVRAALRTTVLHRLPPCRCCIVPPAPVASRGHRTNVDSAPAPGKRQPAVGGPAVQGSKPDT